MRGAYFVGGATEMPRAPVFSGPSEKIGEIDAVGHEGAVSSGDPGEEVSLRAIEQGWRASRWGATPIMTTSSRGWH
jgi:hypothetical protein